MAKGIMFTEPLFNAVIEGRKMQTRRIISEKILDKWYEYNDFASSVGCSGCGSISRYMNIMQYFNGCNEKELNLSLLVKIIGEIFVCLEQICYLCNVK